MALAQRDGRSRHRLILLALTAITLLTVDLNGFDVLANSNLGLDGTLNGAGVGGLAAAIGLAASGAEVTIFERQALAGGKIRSASRDGLDLDVGPTVMTMPWVFEPLFAAAGRSMHDVLSLEQLDILAHHRWPDGHSLKTAV